MVDQHSLDLLDAFMVEMAHDLERQVNELRAALAVARAAVPERGPIEADRPEER